MNEISYLSKTSIWASEFKMIKSGSVVVSGKRSEYAVFSYDDFSPRRYDWIPVLAGIIDDETSPLNEPLKTIQSCVFFDYKGKIWSIVMKSNSLTYDIDQIGFQKILDTFEIIN